MTEEADDRSRVDIRLFVNGPVTLYFNRHFLEEAIEWFGQQNYEVITFDCRTWKSPEDFHTDVSQRLGFPEYYGRNLSAFEDCLSEIDRPQKRGTVLVFLRFDTFTAHFPKLAWNVLDISAVKSYLLLLESYQLFVLAQSDDPRLSFQPVGARPVVWNTREWLNKSRGL